MSAQVDAEPLVRVHVCQFWRIWLTEATLDPWTAPAGPVFYDPSPDLSSTERRVMLFLYRPRETWMPFASPHAGTQQYAYNRQLQQQFQTTRRVPAAVPAAALPPPAQQTLAQRDPIGALKELGALHASGVLTDAEFATAKSRVLAQ